MVEHFWADVAAIFFFSLVGALAAALGIILVDLVTYKICFQAETKKGNGPAAACLMAIILGAFYLAGVVVSSVVSH